MKAFFIKFENIFPLKSTAPEQVEASQLARQSLLNSSDHAGGPVVVMRGGHGAAAPQISHCPAVVGFTSCDGNIGGLKFKTADGQINTKIETPRFGPGRNRHLNGFVSSRSGNIIKIQLIEGII